MDLQTLSFKDFIRFAKSYSHFRVGVKKGCMYFRVTKKALLNSVKNMEADVTFSTMETNFEKNNKRVVFIDAVVSKLLENHKEQ